MEINGEWKNNNTMNALRLLTISKNIKFDHLSSNTKRKSRWFKNPNIVMLGKNIQ